MMKSMRTNRQQWIMAIVMLTLSWASAEEVNLTSGYLAHKIDGISQFTLQGELDGKAKLMLDPNSCSLNAWGDTQVCTLIATAPKDVELVRQRLEDPFGLGRRIYQINNAGLSKPIKLVVGNGSARLLFGAKNGEYIQIPMTAIASKEEANAAWVPSEGTYRATQRQGKVTIYASGEHPTAGFETELKQLPIRIYPPQFELRHKKPSGVAAQVITPFEVTAQFSAAEPVRMVRIRDKNGAHDVMVEQQ